MIRDDKPTFRVNYLIEYRPDLKWVATPAKLERYLVFFGQQIEAAGVWLVHGRRTKSQTGSLDACGSEENLRNVARWARPCHKVRARRQMALMLPTSSLDRRRRPPPPNQVYKPGTKATAILRQLFGTLEMRAEIRTQLRVSGREKWLNDAREFVRTLYRDLPGTLRTARGTPIDGDLWSATDLARVARWLTYPRHSLATAIAMALHEQGAPSRTIWNYTARRLFILRNVDQWWEARPIDCWRHYQSTRSGLTEENQLP